MKRLFVVTCAALVFWAAAAQAATSVYLEELTTTEVSAALRAGSTTVIVPVGGTEQNGPHMVLGKHNVRATVLAGRIAQQLGDTLVAPTVNYVPEGSVQPPGGHMRYAGTLSIPDDVFMGVLRGAAASLRAHGFRHIVLVGDSGNYQNLLQATAVRLNREWAGQPARVHYIAAYYRAASAGFAQTLRAQGLTDAQIGLHAGTADTALSMAVDARLVHTGRLGDAARDGAAGGTNNGTNNGMNNGMNNGTNGDPRPATAALGRLGTDAVEADTVQAIRTARVGVSTR